MELAATVIALFATVVGLTLRSFSQSKRIARLEEALQRHMDLDDKNWATFDKTVDSLYYRIDAVTHDLDDVDKELRETRGIVDGMIE